VSDHHRRSLCGVGRILTARDPFATDTSSCKFEPLPALAQSRCGFDAARAPARAGSAYQATRPPQGRSRRPRRGAPEGSFEHLPGAYRGQLRYFVTSGIRGVHQLIAKAVGGGPSDRMGTSRRPPGPCSGVQGTRRTQLGLQSHDRTIQDLSNPRRARTRRRSSAVRPDATRTGRSGRAPDDADGRPRE
jgi:hypothetical protein